MRASNITEAERNAVLIWKEEKLQPRALDLARHHRIDLRDLL